MNIIFFGSSKFVIPIIETLKQNFDLALVITTEHQPNASVPTYCQEHGIKYISINSSSDPHWKLDPPTGEMKLEIGVLAYFGLILPVNILNLFPKGILNVHPSLLPKYRGPTPVQTAILNGEKETGVTIIKLDEEVDHGPILTQVTEPIEPTDTAETLYARLFTKSAPLLVDSVQKYIKDQLLPKEQNHTQATFTTQLERKSGYIDVTNPPEPVTLNRMIRAYYPWPGVWFTTRIRNQEVRIKILPNKMIQVEGKKPMSYKDFLNGYPEMAGMLLLPASARGELF